MPVSSAADRTLSPLLRPAEVAELLGCSNRQVRAFAERGELPKIRLGRRSTRYRLADVEAFIAAHVSDERRPAEGGAVKDRADGRDNAQA
jgi:excisionase family DNA binding protein